MSTWNPDINFIDNITPLNNENMMKLVNNVEFLHTTIQGLIPMDAESGVTPLPNTSGDGIIRYVVTISRDMIWLNTPTSSNPPAGEGDGRFFIAVLDDENTHRYHLEIWSRKNGAWEEKSEWEKTIKTEGTELEIHYTAKAWDRCTHDKLYVCQNTNKCYYMVDKYGIGYTNYIEPGTTNQSRVFMTETAEAARTIYNGAGTQSIDGWAGYSRSNLLRYKVIIASITVPESSETAGSGPLLIVAFNPWYVINKVTFAPFVKPYGTWDGDSLTGMSVGALRIKDDLANGKFYFDAFIGTAKLRPYIHELVGVADVSI